MVENRNAMVKPKSNRLASRVLSNTDLKICGCDECKTEALRRLGTPEASE